MNDCRHDVEKALVGIVARKVDQDFGSGGHGAGDLDIEHDFSIAAKRIERIHSRVILAAAGERNDGNFRLRYAQFLEVSGKFSRAKAAVEFKDRDGLTRAIELRGEVIKRRYFRWSKGVSGTRAGAAPTAATCAVWRAIRKCGFAKGRLSRPVTLVIIGARFVGIQISPWRTRHFLPLISATRSSVEKAFCMARAVPRRTTSRLPERARPIFMPWAEAKDSRAARADGVGAVLPRLKPVC